MTGEHFVAMETSQLSRRRFIIQQQQQQLFNYNHILHLLFIIDALALLAYEENFPFIFSSNFEADASKLQENM